MKYSVNDLIFPKKLTKKAKNCKLRSTNSIHANVEIKYIDLYDWFADKTKKLGLNCQIKTVTNDYPKFYMLKVGQLSVGKFGGRNFTCTIKHLTFFVVTTRGIPLTEYETGF